MIGPVSAKKLSAAILAANRQSISERIEQRTIAIATSPQLSRLLAEVQEPGGSKIGSTERWQLTSFYAGLLTATEEAYLQYRDGRLTQDFFEARAKRALLLLDNPVGRDYFSRSREAGYFVPEYMEWVDETFGFGSERNINNQMIE